MFKLNKQSQLAIVSSALSVNDYEEHLNKEGFTGGYAPVSEKALKWDDCLSRRIPNFYSLKYGGVEELCLGGEVLSPSGKKIKIKAYPRSATGPDLRRAIIGSKKSLGTFDKAILKVFPLPEVSAWGLVIADKQAQLIDFLRNLIAQFIRPSLLSFYAPDDDSLKDFSLADTNKYILAFQLTGLKSMIAVEKEVAAAEGNQLREVHWVLSKKEIQKLETLSRQAKKFTEVCEQFVPLLGDVKVNDNKFEGHFLKFFRENPC